ncbi:MAG: hypothetical protein P8Y62_06130 [candidate division WOR-3 bacterium]|jgi:hypothetical protein
MKNMQRILIVIIFIVFGSIMISCSSGTKNDKPAEKNQYPIDKRDTIMVSLQEVTDTKVILYSCEQVKVIVSYNALMSNLEEFIKGYDLPADKNLRTELLSMASSKDTINVENIIQDNKLRERLSFRLAELLEKGEATILDSNSKEKIDTIMIEHYEFGLHKLARRGGRRFFLPDGFLFLEVIDWMS